MPRHVLVTGGAGFIGSHLADRLLADGYRVRVLDALTEQVHGDGTDRPGYLSPDIDLMVGDIRDRCCIDAALDGVDAVYHFAAMVGVGQSMYRVGDYVGVNDLGTAVLAEALIARARDGRPIDRLVVASSMSIYGEGLYESENGTRVETAERRMASLRDGLWDPVGPNGRPLTPLPTPETKRPHLSSIYALSKYVQERMLLTIGAAYGIPTVALRFFNVYGTRQALSNPYTGVLAIFAARLLNGRSPVIFEDGLQRRDFVHVADVAEACRLALDAPDAVGHAINVASGQSVTIGDVARRLADALGRPDLKPDLTGRHRVGDIRHCFADITVARSRLGFNPRIGLEEGLAELTAWLAGQAATDRVDQASRELSQRGLQI